MNVELRKLKMILKKIFFQLDEQRNFQKNNEKGKKSKIYPVYKKRSKKELFSIRTKISYNKVFF